MIWIVRCSVTEVRRRLVRVLLGGRKRRRNNTKSKGQRYKMATKVTVKAVHALGRRAKRLLSIRNIWNDKDIGGNTGSMGGSLFFT